jgi:hypothetical protein
MQNPPAQELQPEEAQVIRLILHAIREIRYESVQIVIQDSKVVQIDWCDSRDLMGYAADQTTGG